MSLQTGLSGLPAGNFLHRLHRFPSFRPVQVFRNGRSFIPPVVRAGDEASDEAEQEGDEGKPELGVH